MGGSAKGGGGGTNLKQFFASGGRTGRPSAGNKFGPSGASQNDRSGSPAGGPAGGGGPMTPEQIAMMKSMAKYGAVGSLAGPAGAAAGMGYGAWAENRKQERLAAGAQHISAGTYKNKNVSGGRASMPGRAAGSELYQFSKFNPTDLLTGNRKGGYQGPVRSGAGSSILGGGSDNDDYDETGTYDEYGGR